MTFVRVLARFVIPILIAASGVGALLFASLSRNDATHPDRPTWDALALFFGIAIIVLTLLVGVLNQVLETRRRSGRVEALVAVNGALEPIVTRLARISAMPQPSRPAQLEAIREGCVASALGLVGTEDGRASYFPISGTIGHRVMQDPVTRFGRRNDPPTSEFREGSVVDSEVWGLVDAGAGVLYADLKKHRPESWGLDRQPKYRTFISVGVATGEHAFGMLTINALKPRQLTSEDLASMNVLASLLASAEALCAGTTELNRRRATRRSSGAGDTIPSGGENG